MQALAAAVRQLDEERVTREEALAHVINDTRVRVEPLGCDRHQRDYYILPGSVDQIIAIQPQEGMGRERRSKVAYRTAEEVEALRSWLNAKSSSESRLIKAMNLCLPSLLLAIKDGERVVNGDGRSGDEGNRDGEDMGAGSGRGKRRLRAEEKKTKKAKRAPSSGLVIESWVTTDALVRGANEGGGGLGAGEIAGDGYAGHSNGSVGGPALYGEASKVSLPLFLQRVRALTPRFSVCDGMTWEREGLDECKTHLLALEETCRWGYFVGGGGGGAWVKIEKSVLSWVSQRKAWRGRVQAAGDVATVVRQLLLLARVLEYLVVPLPKAGAGEKVGAGGDVIDQDHSDESSKGGLRDDTCDDDEDLPSFWVIKGGASPTENAAAWRALVGGGADRVSVPVLALAILIFGDRASGCVNVSTRLLSLFCGTGLLCDMISMVANQLCRSPSVPTTRASVCL